MKKKQFESLTRSTQGSMKDSHTRVRALSNSKHIIFRPCLFVEK
jgi:hypothetical protein